jgi:Beta-lactamase class C and other penicillin binding proteins
MKTHLSFCLRHLPCIRICAKTTSFCSLFISLILFVSLHAAHAQQVLTIEQHGMASTLSHSYSQSTTFNVGVGITDNKGNMTFFEEGVNSNDKMFVGSNSKTYGATVILRMVDEGYLKLDDKLGTLVDKYKIDLGTKLPDGAENITVKQLLNMSSRVPNYLMYPRPGKTVPVYQEWAQTGYQSVSDVTPKQLAALGLQNYPSPAGEGTTGEYSNTNMIILSLVAEAAYHQETGKTATFSELLQQYVFDEKAANLPNTSLPSGVAAAGVVGKEMGQPVTSLGPEVSSVSGGILASLADQVSWLRTYTQNAGDLLTEETFKARLDSENSSTLVVHNVLVNYGLGIFTPDLSALGLGAPYSGHGGTTIGYGSFSAWMHDYGLGVVINAATHSSIDKYGNFSQGESETLLADLWRGLRLTQDSQEITDLTTVSELNAPKTGHNILFTQQKLNNSLTVQGTGKDIIYLDLNLPAGHARTIDPTLVYYAQNTDEAGLVVSKELQVISKARMEAFGYKTAMVEVADEGRLSLAGELAAYGGESHGVVVNNGGNITTEKTSLIYMQGGGGSALKITGTGGQADLQGAMSVIGASTALEIEERTVEMAQGSTVSALTTGMSMDPDFKTVAPDTNAAFGVVLKKGATLNSRGEIQASALYPWDGQSYSPGEVNANPATMPGAMAAGVKLEGGALNQTNGMIHGDYAAILLAGSSGDVNRVNLRSTTVTGASQFLTGPDSPPVTVNMYSIQSAGTAANTVSIEDSQVVGNINLGRNANNSLSIKNSNLTLALNENAAAIVGASQLAFGESVTITPVDSQEIFTGFNQPLTSGVVTDLSTAMPSVVYDLPATGSIEVQKNGADYAVVGTRNWTYYRDNTSNTQLGQVLDQLPADYAEGKLSPDATKLMQALEGTSVPYLAAAQLQPLTLHGITLSQLRQASSVRQAANSRRYVYDTKDSSETSETPETNFWYAFGALQGHEIRQKAKGQDPNGYTIDGQSVLVGLGYKLSDTWSAGAFFEYGKEEQDYKHSTGKLDDTITRIGLFSQANTDIVNFFGAASVGFHDIEATRRVRFLNEKYGNEFDSTDFLLTAALWRDFSVPYGFRVSPLAELSYITNDADSYNESKGLSSLHVESASYSYLASSLGADLGYDFAFKNNSVLSLSIGAGWWHQWLDREEVDASLASSREYDFSTIGAKTDNDLARFGIGARYSFSNLSVDLDFERYEGSTMHDNSISFSLKMEF